MRFPSARISPFGLGMRSKVYTARYAVFSLLQPRSGAPGEVWAVRNEVEILGCDLAAHVKFVQNVFQYAPFLRGDRSGESPKSCMALSRAVNTEASPCHNKDQSRCNKLRRARSRLYQGRFLRPNSLFSVVFKIYTSFSILRDSNLKIPSIVS